MDNIEKVYLENKDYIFNYIYSLTKDKDISEDLMSEVFLKSIIGYSGFKNVSSERTWLYSIARYTYYEYIRRQYKDRDLNRLFRENFVKEINLHKLEDRIIEKENIENIYNYMSKLTEREKEIFLYRIKEYSYFEISQIMDLSEGSCRVIYFRAKSKLKELIKKEDFNE